jgi:IS5 family transposase
VRQAILTPAPVSDKTPFLALVQGDERAVYADKGRYGWWYRQELARRGIEAGIMRSAARRVRLTAADHARNRALGVIRAPVERTFATLKRAGTATAGCAARWSETRSSRCSRPVP